MIIDQFKLTNKVAIVTGGTRGIGLSIAHALGEAGAKIIVTSRTDKYSGLKSLKDANYDVSFLQGDITNPNEPQKIINFVLEKYNSIDILVNNAGILRDKSFHKVTLEDFNLVMDVHFQGSLNCTHTVFPIMREQEYGRIVFTSSSSGVFGNFGQTNYGSAKMAMIGLMNTLKLEGQNKNVFTNSITPVAYTRMTEGLIPEDFGKNLQPEFVTPAVIYLASENAPNGVIMAAGAGVFSRIFIHETMGISLGMGEDMTPENIQASWDKISDMEDARALQNGGEQTLKFFELINK